MFYKDCLVRDIPHLLWRRYTTLEFMRSETEWVEGSKQLYYTTCTIPICDLPNFTIPTDHTCLSSIYLEPGQCSEIGSLTSLDACNQEYIRTRVGNSRSFCYECCHGRIRSSSSLPTSVCTKNGKTFILERWTQRWTLYFDEHVHAKCRPSLKCQSKRWSFWRERACTCSALSA